MGERKNIVKEMLPRLGPIKTFEMARSRARDYVYNLRTRGEISFSDPEPEQIPSIHVVRRTLPEAWEAGIMALMGIGQTQHSHYDPGHKTGEYQSFPTLEATTLMHITNLRAEPRFHRFFLLSQFGDYQAEMEGVKDHWVIDPKIVVDLMKQGRFDEIKATTEWLYSYSERLRAYPTLDIEGKPQVINQLQSVIDNLTREQTSRSAQMITWDPRWDHNDGQMKYRGAYPDGDLKKAIFDDYHAPCLQRVWFRLIGDTLNSNTDWRSRCHLKAVPHNIYGMIEGIVEHVRKGLEKSLDRPIKLGRYTDKNDSLHLYGHYFDARRAGNEAETALELVFRIAEGEPIEERLFIPGTPQYDAITETIAEEYAARIANPDLGRSMS